MKIGVAAAGSGGHVYPALAVADMLVGLGLDKGDVIFFGGDRMEARTVPAAGFRFVQLDVHGLRRSLSLDNVTLPMKIRRATGAIAGVIESEGITAMIVFGGYVSGPAGLAARRSKIPLVIHEANAVPGIANRLLAPVADTVYVGFESATRKLRKAVVIGNPLRASFESFDRDALRPRAREHYGLDPGATVLGVFGGSLGAASLNDLTMEMALVDERQYQILHVTGESHYAQIASKASTVEGWLVVPFEVEMERLYAACDLVISRSGAITVSELHATATPSILVPLPAGKGYQALNAEDFAKVGGGVVIAQDRRDEIIHTAQVLLGDEVRRKQMSDTATASRHHGVAREIAHHLIEVASD